VLDLHRDKKVIVEEPLKALERDAVSARTLLKPLEDVPVIRDASHRYDFHFHGGRIEINERVVPEVVVV
jgi:hypothetical protein